jgi:hypothetical protein
LPEHLPSELGDLLIDGIEPTSDLGEVAPNLDELLIDPGELLIDPGELLIDPGELLLDLRELSSEEFDELLVLLCGHASSLSHPHRAFKCIHCDTIPPTLCRAVDIRT